MPRRKNPIAQAVDVGRSTAAIGKMVAGQVGRTAFTVAGGALAGAVGAVGERAGRRKAVMTPGPATSTPTAAPTSPADLRAVPEPVAAEAAVKVQGDPVAPAKKAPAKKAPAKKAPAVAKKAPARKTPATKATPSPADVAKVAKKAPAKKTPAKKAPAKKAPTAPGDRLPARKKPQAR